MNCCEVRPPKGQAIAITERTSKRQDDPNWVAGTGPLSPDAIGRFTTVVAAARKKHPLIDWTGITERDGPHRRVAKWLSEVEN